MTFSFATIKSRSLAGAQGGLWDRFGLPAVAVLVLLTAGLGALGIFWLYESDQEASRYHQIATRLATVLALTVDAETAQRGYVITGREEYLEPYHAALPNIETELTKVDALAGASDVQHAHIEHLRGVLEQKERELGLVIAARRSSGFAAAQAIVNEDRGRQLMDQARASVASLTSEAAARLTARQMRARTVRNSAALAVCLSGTLTAFLLFLFGTSTRRTMQMRARAAEQIAEQKELLQTTISSIGDGVVVTTVDGRVLVLNPVAQAVTKWQETAAIGRRVEDVLSFRHQPTARPLENPVMAALRERRKISLPAQTVLIARDGTETHVEDSCAPIVDAAGRVRGCVMVFRDITVRRRFDDELRASDRRKSEFIATLSHELRNPLAAVRSALDAVRGKPEGIGPKGDLLSLMDRQVRHMVRMIDDLLDVARLERGALQLRPAVVDVARVVTDAVETVQPMLARRAHPLAIHVPAGEMFVLADPARLAQVIANLLTNAVKYSAVGSEIIVNAVREDETIVVSVRDTGIGLSPENLEAIFDIFMQVEPAANEMKEGLGIGLSLARQIITLHHGKIEARSLGSDRGSEFVITLPRQNADALTKPGDAATPGGARKDVQSVLVADDNEDAADALATVLRLSGFDVTVAYNGVEASQLANRLRPDAVLLDIGMPGMSGYEVARSIRDAAWAKRATLIAVTGWGQEDDRKQAAAAGFDMHFTKPVDFGVLHNAILTAGAQEA